MEIKLRKPSIGVKVDNKLKGRERNQKGQKGSGEFEEYGNQIILSGGLKFNPDPATNVQHSHETMYLDSKEDEERKKPTILKGRKPRQKTQPSQQPPHKQVAVYSVYNTGPTNPTQAQTLEQATHLFTRESRPIL